MTELYYNSPSSNLIHISLVKYQNWGYLTSNLSSGKQQYQLTWAANNDVGSREMHPGLVLEK